MDLRLFHNWWSTKQDNDLPYQINPFSIPLLSSEINPPPTNQVNFPHVVLCFGFVPDKLDTLVSKKGLFTNPCGYYNPFNTPPSSNQSTITTYWFTQTHSKYSKFYLLLTTKHRFNQPMTYFQSMEIIFFIFIINVTPICWTNQNRTPYMLEMGGGGWWQ